MKTCQYCGSTYDDTLSYCPSCGATSVNVETPRVQAVSTMEKIPLTISNKSETKSKSKKTIILAVAIGLVLLGIISGALMEDDETSDTNNLPATNEPTYQASNTKTVEQNEVVNADNSHIISVSASSYDIEKSYHHDASKIFDNNIRSCWADGVSGLGIGEYITVKFNGQQKISGLRVWTGHQKSTDLFYKNASPTSFSVIGADGTTVQCTIDDVMGEQRVTFDTPLITDMVKIVIDDVRDGTKWQDTCIAEIKFF